MPKCRSLIKHSNWSSDGGSCATPGGQLHYFLSSYLLTDDTDEPMQWLLPDSTTLVAGDYLIIRAAENKDRKVRVRH
jgi:hypothetical protein